jgi:hypothetical protein
MNQENFDHGFSLDANSPTFAPAANSSVSDPAIMNILAFNFKRD